MMLTQNLGVFVLGLAILVVGAEALIRGAVNLAKRLGVSPFIIGLTLVGFGTSAPELVVNVSAVLQDSPGLAMGNIVGSNIANIGLILGIAAIIRPMAAHSRILRREVPIVLVVSGLLWALVADGELSRIDAGVLLFGLALLGVYLTRTSVAEEPAEVQEEISGLAPKQPSHWGNGLLVLIGLAGLVGGAHLMVESATAIARIWGVPEVVIGLTILAVGTSLPELASTGAAAYRGHSDIAIGNIVGSNMFNILLILGVTGMVQPLEVEPSLLRVDIPVMLGFAFLLLIVLLRGLRIARPEGVLLLAAYIAYVSWQAYIASQATG